MLRSWFSSEAHVEFTPATRFITTNEFESLDKLLRQIRRKEQKLAPYAEASYGSIEQQKHYVLKTFLTETDQLINAFNQQPTPDNPQDNTRQKKEFIRKLLCLLEQTKSRHYSLLNQQRSAVKSTTASAVHTGVFVGSVTAAVFSPPLFLGSGVLTFFGANEAGHSLVRATPLGEKRAHSLILLDALHHLLDQISDSLTLALNGNPRQVRAQSSHSSSRSEEPDAILSIYNPITQAYVDTMQHRESSFSQQLSRLELTPDEESAIEQFQDPITYTIMDIPVLLNGQAYDLSTILALDIRNGTRKDPIKNVEFFIRDLQPAFETSDSIQTLLNQIEQRHESSSNNLRESAHAVNAPGR